MVDRISPTSMWVGVTARVLEATRVEHSSTLWPTGLVPLQRGWGYLGENQFFSFKKVSTKLLSIKDLIMKSKWINEDSRLNNTPLILSYPLILVLVKKKKVTRDRYHQWH